MDKEVSSFVCEACEAMPAVTNGACEEESQPYRLCVDCGHRLDRRSLRPLEWYRLALRHCPHDFLLHDTLHDKNGDVLWEA